MTTTISNPEVVFSGNMVDIKVVAVPRARVGAKKSNVMEAHENQSPGQIIASEVQNVSHTGGGFNFSRNKSPDNSNSIIASFYYKIQ